jgi:hypothetical protein
MYPFRTFFRLPGQMKMPENIRDQTRAASAFYVAWPGSRGLDFEQFHLFADNQSFSKIWICPDKWGARKNKFEADYRSALVADAARDAAGGHMKISLPFCKFLLCFDHDCCAWLAACFASSPASRR